MTVEDMSASNIEILRYNTLTKYDKAPKGAIGKVVDDETYTLYIQISGDENFPSWVPVGDILSKVFEDRLYTQEFVDHILNEYLHQLRQDILDNAINDIISIS